MILPLGIIGLLTILALLAAIMSNRVSPVAALILIPIVAALTAGFGLGTGKMMLDGVSKIAENAAMFVFAILYFGVMSDAGLIDPLVRWVLKAFGSRPSLIVPGSALLALLIHLDGSGAVCFLIAIPAMLPLYDKLGMDRRILACVASLAAGVNFLPWTGPTVRSASVLQVPAIDIFMPMIGVQVVGLVFVFAVAVWLGFREERRLGLGKGSAGSFAVTEHVLTSEEAATRRPKLFWFNLIFTLLVLGLMIWGVIKSPMVIFMAATAIALIVNYPNASEQRARIDAHAKAALLMASVLLAAGVFTGIMNGSGMLKAMADGLVALIPASAGTHIPFALSLVAMPLSLLFDPDSYYFGVMPILAHANVAYGGEAIQVAQASLVGQMTAGFPISPLTPATFLVAGLCRLELGAHQRFAFPYLYAASLVMAVAAVIFRLYPI